MSNSTPSRPSRRNAPRGFSLIEMVIVVVIIAILSAIAVPKLSRGSQGAAESALKGDLRVLRAAVDLYMTEHGGTVPDPSTIEDQLTKYTDDQGTASSTKSGNFMYGPYVKELPTLPLGAQKGQKNIGTTATSTVGWVYSSNSTANTYTILPNTGTLADSSSKLYTDY